jgi:hypothetical protein
MTALREIDPRHGVVVPGVHWRERPIAIPSIEVRRVVEIARSVCPSSGDDAVADLDGGTAKVLPTAVRCVLKPIVADGEVLEGRVAYVPVACTEKRPGRYGAV